MTRILLKGIDWFIWIIAPLIAIYFVFVATYKFEPVRFLTPIEVIVCPEIKGITYKAHFYKYWDLPGSVVLQFVDEKKKVFSVPLEGVRNNPPGENILWADVDLSGFNPVGNVVMRHTVTYTIHFPFYDRTVTIRQPETNPFCVRGGCR